LNTGDRYALTTVPIGEKLMENCADIENFVRLYRLRGSVSYNQNAFPILGYYADTSFFNIFSFDPLIGDLSDALQDPYSIVLTEEMANKLFGDENPIGKFVKLENGDEFEVKAVLKDLKEKTHLNIQGAIASFVTLKNDEDVKFDELCALHNFLTYLLLPQDHEKYDVLTKIDTAFQQIDRELGCADHYKLQKLEDIYFGYKGFDYSLKGQKSLLLAFIASGIVLILIAFINFINLSTATAMHRAKEVGLKKVLGLQKIYLIFQFIGETIILSLFASIIALAIIKSFIVQYKMVFEIKADLFTLPNYLLFFAIITVFGIVASIYPAFFISKYKPITILKGEIDKSTKGAAFRKFLLVFQFSITIILVISSLYVQKQIHYMTDQSNIGFESKDLYYFRAVSLGDKQAYFKQEALNSGLVKHFAYTWTTIGNEFSSYGFEDEEGNGHSYSPFYTDADLIKTIGGEIVLGRDLDENISSDLKGFLMNETAVREFGWGDNPIGKRINDFHCVGVVRDYNIKTFKYAIEPQILYYDTTLMGSANIRFVKGKETEGIEMLKRKWKEFLPDAYVDVKPYSELYDRLYKSELIISKIFRYFSFLSFAIAILGLVGIVSFIIDRRLKEIGIRKVMGASEKNIYFSLNKEFLIYVSMAYIIAAPVAWWLMKKWSQVFVYKSEIDAWIFIVAAAMAYILTIITISYKSIKAARTNPVEVLRHD